MAVKEHEQRAGREFYAYAFGQYGQPGNSDTEKDLKCAVAMEDLGDAGDVQSPELLQEPLERDTGAGHDHASVAKANGPRRVFATGSVRDNCEGKGDPFSIPYEAKRRLGVHFENGGKKYDRFNWRLGQPMSELLNSASRHLDLLMAGKGDEDHAAAVLWNVAVYMDQERRLREGSLPASLEDRPEDLIPRR